MSAPGITRFRRLLPTGVPLSDDIWQRRHRGIVTLLGLHVLVIPAFGIVRGFRATHMVLETLPVLIPAIVALRTRYGKDTRMVAATFGLLSASAILVHLSGGVIETHFHFFVMVAVITLYQSWLPFLLAIGYVVIHHGVMGAIDPSSVYNHPAARTHPWRWAGIHGGFILAESVACLTAWRLNEVAKARADEFSQELAALVRSSDDAIVGLLADGRVASWNPGAERLFGYQGAEILGRSFTALIPDDRVEDEKKVIDRFLEQHVVERYETQSLRKDGSLVDVAITLSPIEGDDGAPAGASVIARNITQRKIAEREREESLSLLSATLESTADGLLVVDLEGSIVSFNQKFLELWKIPDEIVAARDDNMAISYVLDQLSDPEAFLAQVRDLYSRPHAKSFDLLEFKDGKIFERYSQPQEVQGKVVGRVWSFRDVTDREQAKKGLQEAFQREKEVAESLRSVDDMKNAFLEAVSHELRTPLTNVLGSALTLEAKRGELSDQVQGEMFQSLTRNARKLERLLSDLLDVDRLIRGALKPRLAETDVATLVEGSVSEVDPHDHPIEVSTEPIVAFVDGPKVQRIIENLVANAVKYTPEGTRIRVSMVRIPEGIAISVEDEGPGVPDSLKVAAFEPFRRGTTSLHSPGTGIGLALVSRFAELHGGKAWVEDRPGGGAIFHVTIPCQVLS